MSSVIETVIVILINSTSTLPDNLAVCVQSTVYCTLNLLSILFLLFNRVDNVLVTVYIVNYIFSSRTSNMNGTV